MNTKIPAKIRRGFVDVGGSQIHYRWLGETGAPVLFLHQVSSSSRMFEQLMPRFVSHGYRTLAMDYPGFGDSDPPAGFLTVADYADTVAGFLGGLGLVQPIVVIGHHTGAVVGVELAASRPERVRQLVLVGAPYYPSRQARDRRWDEKKREAIVPKPDASHLLWEWNRLRGHWPDMAVELLHRELVDTLKAPRYDLAYRAVFDYEFEQRFPLVRCPTLIISGGNDVVKTNQAAAQAIPGAQLVVIEKGSTFMCDEMPDEVAAAALEFLRTTAPCSSSPAP